MGTYVRDQRKRLGMTQEDLGQAVGISKGYVSQIESGKISFPNADLRRRLAVALGVRHIDLIVAAGELTDAEVPGPSRIASQRDPGVETIRALLDQIDMTTDRRAASIIALLQMYRAQDHARSEESPPAQPTSA